MPEPLQIAPATGRLGILTPGMGAVASTAYAGVLAVRTGPGRTRSDRSPRWPTSAWVAVTRAATR